MSTAEGPSRRHDEESDPWVDESLQWRRCYDETEAELDITLSNAGAETLLRYYPRVRTIYVRFQPDEEKRTHSVTTESIEAMFSTLGDHPSIEKLVLDNLEGMEDGVNCQCQFPIRALTFFIHKCRKLKSVLLDIGTAIAGGPNDGATFLKAIKDHPVLDTLEIGDFGAGTSSISASEFSPLMVPKWVELTLTNTGDQITAEQVDLIVESPCLRKLLVNTSAS